MNLELDAELLRTLLEDVPARVVVFDREQRYCYANRATLDFLGLSPEQLIGRTVSEIRGQEVAERNRAVFDQVFDGATLHWEGWADYAGIGLRYTEESLRPYPAQARPVQWVLGFARDLTEVKNQARQAQEQLEAALRAEVIKTSIVDHALAALVTSDAEGRIVEFNPAAEAMFQRQRDAVLGLTVAEVMVPPEFRAAHTEGMRRVVQGGAPRVMGKRLEMQALRADGERFPIEMALWRIEVKGQTHYTASIIDVSERVRAQALIERQREALRQSEKLGAMGSLLAGVAHELNNPLAIVMGRASLLEEKAQGSALADDALRIREAAERCGRIVRTFLNMARSRPGERAAVGLNELVRAALDLLQYGLRSHGIQLALQLDPALPAVYADPDQLGQVVLNLIVNAQQALALVEPPRSLSISSGVETLRPERESRVWLRVQDRGPGVPTELRETIFEPFFTTKPEGMGTGLGLAVSRSLVREHGGELQLEPPRPGQGACFRISLPISGQGQLPTEQALVPGEAPAQARLLVVDDEAEIADLLRTLLEGAGYEVACAETGEVALELLQMARFDAVISDLRMPGLDGAALWRALKTDHPKLLRRLLFVTGDTLSPDASRFLDDTGCPHLDKPFAKAELLAAVERLLK